MPASVGTRHSNGTRNNHPESSKPNSISTRDLGMSKRVVASITFNSGTKQATAAATTFAAFAVNDRIEVSGSATCNGFYSVLATDKSTYLTLDPPPKTAGAATVTIRTV